MGAHQGGLGVVDMASTGAGRVRDVAPLLEHALRSEHALDLGLVGVYSEFWLSALRTAHLDVAVAHEDQGRDGDGGGEGAGEEEPGSEGPGSGEAAAHRHHELVEVQRCHQPIKLKNA